MSSFDFLNCLLFNITLDFFERQCFKFKRKLASKAGKSLIPFHYSTRGIWYLIKLSSYEYITNPIKISFAPIIMHAVRNEAKLDFSRAHISKIYPLLCLLTPMETFKVWLVIHIDGRWLRKLNYRIMRDNFKIYNSIIVNVQNLDKN